MADQTRWCFMCGKPVSIGNLGMLMRPDGSRPHDCGEDWLVEHGYAAASPPLSPEMTPVTTPKAETPAKLRMWWSNYVAMWRDAFGADDPVARTIVRLEILALHAVTIASFAVSITLIARMLRHVR